MASALIGYSGFVGSNLARQLPFDALFSSKNIHDIAGRRFDLLVVSAMPAAKWIANRDPAADRAQLDLLVGCLRQVEARQAVIISTVDVFPSPVGVDEDSLIDPLGQQPYGRHRLLLERAASTHFASVLVLRLPGLFGAGLKKNAIYDLLHHNDVDKINAESVFQFYNLDHLWADVQTSLRAGLRLVHFSTEPISVRNMAQEAFGLRFENRTQTPPVRYDFRSRHESLFGGCNGYLYSRDQVLRELADFVQHREPHCETVYFKHRLAERQDAPVAELLVLVGVQGIEIAATKVWPSPLGCSGCGSRCLSPALAGAGLTHCRN